MFIESWGEVCIQQKSIMKSLSHHSSDKFKVRKMLRVDIGLRIRLESVACTRFFEQSIVRIKHIS